MEKRFFKMIDQDSICSSKMPYIVHMQAHRAIEKAENRLVNLSNKKIELINKNSKSAPISKENFVDFFSNYKIKIQNGFFTASISQEQCSAEKKPHPCFYVGLAFGIHTEEQQESIILHEVGHGIFGDTKQKNYGLAKLKIKKKKYPYIPSPVIAAYYSFPIATSNQHFKERRADFFSDVAMPEVSHKDVLESFNNFSNSLTHKKLKFENQNFDPPYKDNILGKMTKNYDLLIAKTKNLRLAKEHPDNLNRAIRSQERCAAILNGETKLKL